MEEVLEFPGQFYMTQLNYIHRILSSEIVYSQEFFNISSHHGEVESQGNSGILGFRLLEPVQNLQEALKIASQANAFVSLSGNAVKADNDFIQQVFSENGLDIFPGQQQTIGGDAKMTLTIQAGHPKVIDEISGRGPALSVLDRIFIGF